MTRADIIPTRGLHIWPYFLLFCVEVLLCQACARNVNHDLQRRPSSSLSSDHDMRKRTTFDEEFDLFYKYCGSSFDLQVFDPGEEAGAIGLPESEPGAYITDLDCSIEIIGHRNCIPTVQCATIDLRKFGKDCSKEFVEISDGLGGMERYCDKNGFEKPVKPSRSSYDLYLRFVISKDTNFNRKYGGAACTIMCEGDDGQDGKPRALALRGPKRKFDDKCVCGVRRAGRVVGGQNVMLNEFPWQVAMVKAGTRMIRCGASLINDMYILTAAHCVIESDELIGTDTIEVLLHVNLLDQFRLKGWVNASLGEEGSIQSPGWELDKKTDKDERTVRIGVERIIAHPNFDMKNMDFDVALLVLKQRVSLNDNTSPVVPICLPDLLLPEKELEGQRVTVVGWGLAHEKAKGSTRMLQKLEMPYYTHEQCEEATHTSYTERMLCAGFIEGKKDACTGDSGGPLLWERKKSKLAQSVQVGIVSYGDGCAREGKLGVYSRVSVLLPWIYQHAPGATWCLDDPSAATSNKPAKKTRFGLSEPLGTAQSEPMSTSSDAGDWHVININLPSVAFNTDIKLNNVTSQDGVTLANVTFAATITLSNITFKSAIILGGEKNGVVSRKFDSNEAANGASGGSSGAGAGGGAEAKKDQTEGGSRARVLSGDSSHSSRQHSRRKHPQFMPKHRLFDFANVAHYQP